MNQFNSYIWMAVLSALGCVAGGALFYAWLARRAVGIRQSIPASWPLSARLLVNTEECQVWHWLCKTFPLHHVGVKIPVIRFTQPLEREQGQDWYKLLHRVYCTFTVCSPDGHVVGCADVMGRNGLATSNRHLKQTLLAQCGVAYYVLKSKSLPTTAEIRSDFLGETVPTDPASTPPEPSLPKKSRVERERELEQALLAEARLKLSTALNRQRRIRDSGFSPLTLDSDSHTSAYAYKSNFEEVDTEGHSMLPGWQHNSFITPLDSRIGELHDDANRKLKKPGAVA